MTERLESSNRWETIFLFLGILFPIVLRLSTGIYHNYDVETFAQWSPYLSPLRNTYLTDCYCNYPIFGLLFSSGIIQLFGGSIFGYLIFLSFVEALNVFLVWKILKNLSIRSSGLWTFLISILPSTWIGASLWGQIDHIGYTQILVVLLIFIQCLKSRGWIWYLLLGGMFYFTIFTKQLMVFPLLALGIFALFDLFLSDTKTALKSILFASFGVILPFIAVELFLYIPHEYIFTHYEKILATGSDHMDKISGNGVNFWLLIFDDMYASSTQKMGIGVSPKNIGIILFVASSIGLTVKIWKYLQLNLINREKIALLVFFIAVFNLSFNILLTGVHERYLYYFFPFLIIGVLGLKKKMSITQFDFGLIISSSILYGFHVLGCLLRWYQNTETFHYENSIQHKITAFVLLILFVRITYLFYTLNFKSQEIE